jgi:heat shock protein HslJ
MHRSVTKVILALALLAATIAACGGSAGGGDLTGKDWQWTASTVSEPATIPDPSLYTITFAEDGTFAAKVDCNQVAGTYTTADGGAMTIVPGPSTLAACPEGSLADVYLAALGGVTSYAITGDQLVLTTATGTLTFE